MGPTCRCVRACVRRYACVCLRVARPHRGMQICTLPWKRTPLQNTEQDRWHFNGEVEVDTESGDNRNLTACTRLYAGVNKVSILSYVWLYSPPIRSRRFYLRNIQNNRLWLAFLGNFKSQKSKSLDRKV